MSAHDRHLEGPRYSESITMKCATEGCPEKGLHVEVHGTSELGGFFLDNDDDVVCGACGEEMVDV